MGALGMGLGGRTGGKEEGKCTKNNTDYNVNGVPGIVESGTHGLQMDESTLPVSLRKWEIPMS